MAARLLNCLPQDLPSRPVIAHKDSIGNPDGQSCQEKTKHVWHLPSQNLTNNFQVATSFTNNLQFILSGCTIPAIHLVFSILFNFLDGSSSFKRTMNFVSVWFFEHFCSFNQHWCRQLVSVNKGGARPDRSSYAILW